MEPESDETNEQLAIELLSRAKTYLDAMPTNLQPQEYQKIIELVNNYIEKNCKHKIIDDSIDVGYEQIRTIRYCELCLKTFN